MRHQGIIFLIIGLFFVSVNTALAEHEVDHRYNVRGYVLDGNERALSDLEVLVFDGAKLLSKTKTDSAGYYTLHLHLHNEDNNRLLKIRAGSNNAGLRVKFDPADLNTQRIHEANFVGGKYIEGTLDRFRIPPWAYALAGFVAVFFIAVKLEKRRKRKIRLAKMSPEKKKSSKRHKHGKAGRK